MARFDSLGLVHPEMDVQTFRGYVARARQKLIAGDAASPAIHRLAVIETQVAAGIVSSADALWVAQQFVRAPSAADITALHKIFEWCAVTLTAIVAGELWVGFTKHRMPYDDAVQAAADIVEGVMSGGNSKWVANFLLSEAGPAALRSMASYIEQHDAPLHWQHGWATLKQRAVLIHTLADVCDTLRMQ